MTGQHQDDLRLPAPDLIWDGDRPSSVFHEDGYFGAVDPLAESRHVFLDGAGIDLEFESGRPVAVGETGFGSGLNFLAALERRRQLGNRAPLIWLSLEGYPMRGEDMSRTLAPFNSLRTDAARLRALWPAPYPGIHRLVPSPGVTLLLAFGQAGMMLPRIEGRFDFWFLDGFAPSRNGDMWSDPVIREIARLSRPGTRLATFTAAGIVARGLASHGFSVTKRPGFGLKREHITATFDRPALAAQDRAPVGKPWFSRSNAASHDIAVIGGGIAAATLGHALRQAGRAPVMISQQDSAILPAALLAPRPDLGSGAPARLLTLAMREAMRFASALPDDCHAGPLGVLDLLEGGASQEHAGRLIARFGWPGSEVRLLSASDASDTAGLGLRSPALFWPAGATLDPRRVIDRLCEGLAHIPAKVAALHREGDYWCVTDATGRTIHAARDVVIAAGPDSARLAGPRAPELVARRGQIVLLPPMPCPRLAIAFDGFLTPVLETQAGRFHVLGSSFGPLAGEDGQGIGISVDERKAMLARLTAFGLSPKPLGDWAGIRVSSADHLPFAGPLPDREHMASHFHLAAHDSRHRRLPPPLAHDGLWIFAGLGARGFQYAPLLAAMLAAEMAGQPSPVERGMREAVHPARFMMRRLIKGNIPAYPADDDGTERGC